MLLVTRVIRGGRTVAQESVDFGVDEKIGGRTFRQSVRAMAEMFRDETPRPTREEVFNSTPAGFVQALGGLKDTGLIRRGTCHHYAHPSFCVANLCGWQSTVSRNDSITLA